jgi:hypothetical protein
MKKLAHALALVMIGGVTAGVLSSGCANSGSTDDCAAGTFRQCACEAGDTGTQACATGGSGWGACVCNTGFLDGGADAAGDAAGVCGDGTCNSNESCITCPADCGMCPACSTAPSCTGASSVPSQTTALASFSNASKTMYTSGVGFTDPVGQTICSVPLLKLRLSQIQVRKNGAPGSGLQMFCMVQADDGQSSQLLLTPQYMNLSDNNPPIVLSPAQGTFWGQAVDGVKLSQFNLTATYQCFMVLQPGALQSALNAIAGVAGSAAGIPGNPYGWAFGVGGAAAAAAAAAAATGTGTTPLLNVQQTIDQSALLKLTNGYTWSIEETGSTKADGDCGFFGSCDWDWELDVEAWGCAAPKGDLPR